MSKEKDQAAAPQLKEDVLALAEKIAKGIELDKKSGVGTASEDLYKDNLPDGLSPEVVKQVSDYNGKFIAAGAYAFGKMAVTAMAGNKSLETATCELKVGHRDSVGYTVTRHKEYTNHLGGGEKTEKFGVVTATYDVRAGKNNGGQLKAARAAIAELGMQKLK